MKNLLLHVTLALAVLLLGSAALALADEQVADEITLPSDGRKIAVIVVTHDDWRKRPQERRMLRWFHGADRALTKLAVEADFHHYTESDPIYRAKYQQAYGVDFPLVAVQMDAAAIPVVAGESMPDDAKELSKHIGRWLKKLRPLKAVRQRREQRAEPEKMNSSCVDCDRGPQRTRQRRGLFRRFNRGGDDKDGAGEEPPLDESSGTLTFPDYQAPMPTAANYAEIEAENKAEADAALAEVAAAAERESLRLAEAAAAKDSAPGDIAQADVTEDGIAESKRPAVKKSLLAVVVTIVLAAFAGIIRS
jgi:hypothetical protein